MPQSIKALIEEPKKRKHSIMAAAVSGCAAVELAMPGAYSTSLMLINSAISVLWLMED